jgi:hypothetical protein
MSDIITTAGLEAAFSSDTRVNRRKEAIKEIRSKLRRQDATDDEWDDALDALIELSQDKGDIE